MKPCGLENKPAHYSGIHATYYAVIRESVETGNEHIDSDTFSLLPEDSRARAEKKDKKDPRIAKLWPAVRLATLNIKEEMF